MMNNQERHWQVFTMDDQNHYQLARMRVQQLRYFYTHVGVFVFVNVLLILINLLTDPASLWFYWPLFGWGIAVAVNAFIVYGTGGIMGKEWEERKIREILEWERIM